MRKDDEDMMNLFGFSTKQENQKSPSPPKPQVRVTNVSGMSPEEQAIIEAADRYLQRKEPKLKPEKEKRDFTGIGGWIVASVVSVVLMGFVVWVWLFKP